jgi:hypothetical protein
MPASSEVQIRSRQLSTRREQSDLVLVLLPLRPRAAPSLSLGSRSLCSFRGRTLSTFLQLLPSPCPPKGPKRARIPSSSLRSSSRSNSHRTVKQPTSLQHFIPTKQQPPTTLHPPAFPQQLPNHPSSSRHGSLPSSPRFPPTLVGDEQLSEHNYSTIEAGQLLPAFLQQHVRLHRHRQREELAQPAFEEVSRIFLKVEEAGYTLLCFELLRGGPLECSRCPRL